MTAVRVQREGFSIDREVEEVKRASRTIGAVVAFSGVARDFSRGEAVTKLSFEHYPEMAGRQLGELRDEALERFGLLEMRIVHRFGEILPGEDIVLIVAAAEHRAAAFEAAAWAIAELKVRVPIWKKEFTAAGEVWVDEVPGAAPGPHGEPA